MKFYRIVFPAIIAFVLILTSCNSSKNEDPEPVKTDDPLAFCIPISIRGQGGDSIAYEYSGAGKLTAIRYFHDFVKTDYRWFLIEYNEKGNPSRVLEYTSSVTTSPIWTYELEYDVNDKVISSKKIDMIFDAIPSMVTTYLHDSKGRLTQIDMSFLTVRYEYDEKGNVPKIYFTSHMNEPAEPGVEELARENLSFDDKPIFYSNVKELVLINQYLFGHIPGINNPTSISIKSTYTPGSIYSLTMFKSFTPWVGYDKNGWIEQWLLSSFNMGSTDLMYNDARYKCE